MKRLRAAAPRYRAPITEKPLLLIDVDGPLNPYDAKPTQRPDGYGTWRYSGGKWVDRHAKGLRVWLNPAHGPMLLALADRFELTWCTAWRQDANRLIAPAIGLPELPVIDLSDHDVPLHGIWKRPSVETYANGRPLAWFDDEFEPADDDWAGKRTADGAPTLLVRIDPKHGIRQQDVDRVAEWAPPILNSETTEGTA